MSDTVPQIIDENEFQNVVISQGLIPAELFCLYFCQHFYEALKKIVALQIQL